MDVSICEITGTTELPKRYFTWTRSTKSMKFGSPTSEKVVLFGFKNSGGLEISSG